MDLHISLKNYRCFGERPVAFTLKQGTTAFLGPNNIGKSAICKLFYGLRPVFEQLLTFPKFHNWLPNRDISRARNGAQTFEASGIGDLSRWACRFSTGECELTIEIPNISGIRLNIDWRKSEALEVKAWSTESDVSITTKKTGDSEYTAFFTKGDKRHSSVNSPPPDIHSKQVFDSIKPIFECLSRVCYLPAGRHVMLAQGEQPFDLRLGQELFTQWRAATGGLNPDASLHARNLVTQLGNIFGDPNLQIRTEEQVRTLLVTYRNHDFTIGELGNGIGQFVDIGISTLSNTPSILFIDEPETGLHPSLQEELIDFLIERTSHGLVFTTHSVGLARATAESIFSIAPHDDSHPEITTFEAISNLAEFLGEMSFSSYQELGYSRLLFVEGKTDIGPIRHWLRELNVDHKVVVMSLAGESGISMLPQQLSELKRICTDIWVIIDSEKSSEDAPLSTHREAAQLACCEQNVECHVLERRALENYFPSRAVKKVKGDSFEALGPYEPKWHGHDKMRHNLQMAEATRLADVQGRDLEAFLAKVASFHMGTEPPAA
jgi:energy-coupling factor transporter ATP-binding protein EcfA2